MPKAQPARTPVTATSAQSGIQNTRRIRCRLRSFILLKRPPWRLCVGSYFIAARTRGLMTIPVEDWPRREDIPSMRTCLRFLCLPLALAIYTGCAAQPHVKRPYVYRGGQYYGDALHAEDLQAARGLPSRRAPTGPQ